MPGGWAQLTTRFHYAVGRKMAVGFARLAEACYPAVCSSYVVGFAKIAQVHYPAAKTLLEDRKYDYTAMARVDHRSGQEYRAYFAESDSLNNFCALHYGFGYGLHLSYPINYAPRHPRHNAPSLVPDRMLILSGQQCMFPLFNGLPCTLANFKAVLVFYEWLSRAHTPVIRPICGLFS